jgi:hypothetical protein
MSMRIFCERLRVLTRYRRLHLAIVDKSLTRRLVESILAHPHIQLGLQSLKEETRQKKFIQEKGIYVRGCWKANPSPNPIKIW